MMNTVQALLQRQMGNAFPRQYDVALSRLCVHVKDNWRGLSSSVLDGEYALIPPIYSAKFANTANAEHLLALANEDGKIAIHDTDKVPFGEEAGYQLPGYQCHNNAVCDIAWMPGEMKIVSASSDSKSCLWDVHQSDLVHLRTFTGHTRSVKTVAFRHEDSAVFATGGRDGAILIWDTRISPSVAHIPRADNCILSGHAESYESRLKKSHVANACKSSITGLGFQYENTLISCGAGDGVVKVWDLRRNYTAYKKEPLPKHSLPYRGTSTFKGFTNLVIDPRSYRLYVSCMDNTIYCYNISSYDREPLQRYIGFKNSSYYIRACLSPDGQYLLSGSSDEKAYVWNVENPRPVVTLSGDESYSTSQEVEVSCVAWSGTRDFRLVTCSDDARHKIWRVGPIEIEPSARNYRGWAYLNPDYGKKVKKSVKGTPKMWWNNGSCTPSSSGRVALKRTFAELDDDFGEARFGDAKRLHIEPRGRRLFATATVETDNPPHELKSPVKSPTKSSPLSERVNVIQSPESPSTSHVPVPLFSPTSNLPNYVMDGEAPHLRITSPKRKLKENVDWLTKIRKQKLQQVASSLTLTCGDGGSSPRPSSPAAGPMSPRIQSLRDGEATSPQSGTPRRRKSRSSSTSDRPKTPNSTRNPSESILRFLTPTSSSAGHK
ncbi:protein lethal(2)denticleless [Phlebotomus argentipes]|uniref:protein lethal(2)denticleless n=1 Tax=Phlebotomus argentipes TaxID=94469 RepID=UPI0028934AA3|nr:protein lethal(2)denticleless [Phlebotomus argentipes]